MSASWAVALTLTLSACVGPSAGGSEAATAAPTWGYGAETATVQRVVDGDTLALTDGRRVRILGIDACELKTPGGKRAKTEAARILPAGTRITLTREKRDTERYGRYLRYVVVNGHDYGTLMVRQNHTSVYAGKNDAAPGYVADLRRNDTDGRNCNA